MADDRPDNQPSARAAGHPLRRPTPLFEWAERFAKITAVLVVFGYISLRVHWNHHGIPSTAWLGVDTYLVELYGIILTMLLQPWLVFLVVGALCMVGAAVGVRRLLIRSSWVRQTEDRLVGGAILWFRSPPGAATMLLLGLVSLGLVGRFLVPHFRWAEHDLVVGQLDACRLAARNRSEWSYGWLLFWLTGTAALVGYAAYVRLSPYAEAQASPAACFGTRCLWRAFAVVLLVLVLWLPYIYGVSVHVPGYRVALVDTRSKGALLGLLVLDTSTQVELWSAERGVGSVMVLPRGEIQKMKIGSVCDLREVALQAACDPETAWPKPEMLHGRAQTDSDREGG